MAVRYLVINLKRYTLRGVIRITANSKIDEMGAGMYKGENVTQLSRHEIMSDAQIKKLRK